MAAEVPFGQLGPPIGPQPALSAATATLAMEAAALMAAIRTTSL